MGVQQRFPLRYLFATNQKAMSPVLTIVHRVISASLIKRSGGREVGCSERSGDADTAFGFSNESNLTLTYTFSNCCLLGERLLLASEATNDRKTCDSQAAPGGRQQR